MSIFSERLRKAMDAAGKKPADLVRETGLDKGAVSCYMSGKYEPKQKAVDLLARALDVSASWLVGAAESNNTGGKNMSNIITIELCAEDRARLDRLSAALENNNPLTKAAAAITNLAKSAKEAADAAPADMPREMRRFKSMEDMAEYAKVAWDAEHAEAAQDAATEPEPEAPMNDTPAEEEAPTAAPAPSEEVAEPAPVPSVDELRAIVQELAAPGSSKRAAVRALVKSYADSVSNIPEDKRAEAMQKLIELKEGEA